MKFQKTLFALAFACSSVVFAANDGNLGASSSGDTEVSVAIGDLVRVLVEGDITLTHSVGANSTGGAGLCIYRNGSSSVNLTLTSGNPDASDGFQMVSGTNNLPYSVSLSGDDTVGSFTSGTFAALSGANSTSANCGGAGTYGHSLDVGVQSGDLDAAPAGTYSDTVTILVEAI